MNVKNIGLAFGITTFSLFVACSKAQAMLGWNFSYVNQSGDQATGIFTTDQTTYDPTGNTTYTVQSITGTRTPNLGSPVLIEGLSSFPGISDNTFRWNGNQLLLNVAGIAYSTINPDGNLIDFVITGSPETQIYQPASVELAIDYPDDTNGTPLIDVTLLESSSLTPAVAVEVPEPSISQGLAIVISFFYGLKLKKNIASKNKVKLERIGS